MPPPELPDVLPELVPEPLLVAPPELVAPELVPLEPVPPELVPPELVAAPASSVLDPASSPPELVPPELDPLLDSAARAVPFGVPHPVGPS